MNYSNIKVLFLIINTTYKDIKYIFLISEDKYQYTIASYVHRHIYYSLYTINKITHDLEFTTIDSIFSKELNRILKRSENVEEYNYSDIFDYKNIIIKHTITHIRKLKIENICQ